MKIIHVIDTIQKQASGPSYTVVSLCEALAKRGHDVELHVLAPAPDLGARGFTLHAHPRGGFPRRLGGSRAARRALFASARTADIVHTHGLWRMPHIYAASAAASASCGLVASPRGALSAWARAWHVWRKRIMWWTVQRRALRRADLFHATASREADEIRAAGLLAPIAVIPNGVDAPPDLPGRSPSTGPRRLLFLGRIHPIKGLDRLLEAWRAVQDAAPEWELHVVGFDEDGYTGRLQALAQQLGTRRVHFAGPVYGEEKEALLRSTDLFILPSHTENFSMAVAEALSRRVPVVATRGTPWEGLVEHGCGWWVEGDPSSLAACLREALALPSEDLAARGSRGREWMLRDLRWERIAERMESSYRWIRERGAKPPWIQETRT